MRGTYYGLRRYRGPVKSPSWILPKVRSYRNMVEIDIFNARCVESRIITLPPSFCQHFLLLSPQNDVKHAFCT